MLYADDTSPKNVSCALIRFDGFDESCDEWILLKQRCTDCNGREQHPSLRLRLAPFLSTLHHRTERHFVAWKKYTNAGIAYRRPYVGDTCIQYFPSPSRMERFGWHSERHVHSRGDGGQLVVTFINGQELRRHRLPIFNACDCHIAMAPDSMGRIYLLLRPSFRLLVISLPSMNPFREMIIEELSLKDAVGDCLCRLVNDADFLMTVSDRAVLYIQRITNHYQANTVTVDHTHAFALTITTV